MIKITPTERTQNGSKSKFTLDIFGFNSSPSLEKMTLGGHGATVGGFGSFSLFSLYRAGHDNPNLFVKF